ncbi:MAG: transposase, partial [Clostridia bacterium]|nr:transposase [Deltaproteobacteria bacterium]
MIDVARENRLDVLRQVAQLQQNEIIRLRRELQARLTELARLRADPTLVQQELLKLEEQLAAREQALFGRSSEKTPPPPASAIGERNVTQKQTGHSPRAQPELEHIVREHVLDAADQMCPSCGGDLTPWTGQTEDSEEIDVVERQFVVVKHHRQKYRCGCGNCIETALGPTKLKEGSRYSIGFAVEVAIAKYCDHLPLERQVRIMRREGLHVDSQTLWDQIETLARLVRDVPERIRIHLLAKAVVGMDETRWPLLEKSPKTWQGWSLTGDDAVYHRIADT